MSSKNFPLSQHISSEHRIHDQKFVWGPTTSHTLNEWFKIIILKFGQDFLENR